jgi:hypothetical protein
LVDQSFADEHTREYALEKLRVVAEPPRERSREILLEGVKAPHVKRWHELRMP